MMKTLIFAAIALWFGTVWYLGAQGFFVGSPSEPPLRLFLGMAVPLIAFFAAYARWSTFREFILSADLRFVSAIQAWRWAGVHFLFVYAQGALPGLFALPAGVGDMAVGVTAPWIVLNLIRDPSFATSRSYRNWNILGIFDFVFATAMAVLTSGLFPGMSSLTGHVTSAAMGQLPLVFTPVFVVPFFAMLHSTALLKARHLAREGVATSASSGFGAPVPAR